MDISKEILVLVLIGLCLVRLLGQLVTVVVFQGLLGPLGQGLKIAYKFIVRAHK